MERRGTVALANSTDSCRQTICRPDAEFAPGIPHWPGFPDEARKTIYWYEKRSNVMGTGFFSELYTHVGQWGTHVDPPAHFIKGLRTVDQIDPKEMVLPLVIIDVHEEATKN